MGENPIHRMPKVSWGRLIHPGLGGPKPNPKGVGDGQPVNIPAPPGLRYEQRGDAVGASPQVYGYACPSTEPGKAGKSTFPQPSFSTRVVEGGGQARCDGELRKGRRGKASAAEKSL